jgi:segregation and condensation protein B
MEAVQTLPELKQILGALLFSAKQPMTVADVRRTLQQVAEARSDAARDFAALTEREIREALDGLRRELEAARAGLLVVEVADGYRLVNDPSCGVWLRHYLNRAKPTRLSRPALETLAIIAYRQPCTRAEIESVRGVDVDQMVRNLLELQLIRITGRSELPGRPWQLGTTQKFLEYFGLKNLEDLPGAQELRRMEAEQLRRRQQSAPASEASAPGEPAAPEDGVSGPAAVAMMNDESASSAGAVSGGAEATDAVTDESDDEYEDEYEDEEEEEESDVEQEDDERTSP